jgi:hypothetical protein
MIVQISMVRNELHLIKELLPIWSKYVDGFVFMCDTCTDGTVDYLNSVKDQFNILEVLEELQNPDDNLWMETNTRGRLFETAKRYTNKIICLDADEYLDGQLTKQELNDILSENEDTTFYLQWIQYTSCNTIRIDGPWKNNLKDRIGNYSSECNFTPTQMHSTHLPIAKNQKILPSESLFISHFQWVDKTHVAIKQYYWKTVDYVNNKLYGVQVAGNSAYDASVNNFNWEEEYTYYPLKISPYILEKHAIKNNYRLQTIKEFSKKYDIPNLGDWGLDLLSIDEKKADEINQYKVSVVTAIGSPKIYSKYFKTYLENILDQHFFLQTEHIIVYSEWDEFFNEFKKYTNFKLIKEEETLGVYNAWNIGIKAASTEYVTNWNIDDLRHPINTKIKYDLLKNNNFDIAYNWYVATSTLDENFYNIDFSSKIVLRYPDNYENHVMENCYAGPDPMWKKSLHDTVGYFDYENYPSIGDWEMWIRFAKKANAKFKLIPEVLCIYRDHPGTVSRAYHEKSNQQKIKLFKQYT